MTKYEIHKRDDGFYEARLTFTCASASTHSEERDQKAILEAFRRLAKVILEEAFDQPAFGALRQSAIRRARKDMRESYTAINPPASSETTEELTGDLNDAFYEKIEADNPELRYEMLLCACAHFVADASTPRTLNK